MSPLKIEKISSENGSLIEQDRWFEGNLNSHKDICREVKKFLGTDKNIISRIIDRPLSTRIFLTRELATSQGLKKVVRLEEPVAEAVDIHTQNTVDNGYFFRFTFISNQRWEL